MAENSSLCPSLKIKCLSYVLMTLLVIIVSGVVAELGAQLYFLAANYSWFWQTVRGKVNTNRQAVVTSGQLIHPYFGYVLAPHTSVESVVGSGRIGTMTTQYPLPRWTKYRPNNHGFWSPHDYPFSPPRDSHYVIGIFGGSVAQWFALQGSDRLVKRLESFDKLSGKKVSVLNFAVGGMKQPQQNMILNYFMILGQRFDCVVNIDGFNEIALTMAENLPKGIHVSMPRSYPVGLSALSNIASDEVVLWRARIVELRQRINSLKKLETQSWSAAIYYLSKAFATILNQRLASLEGSAPNVGESEKNAFFVLPETVHRENESNLDELRQKVIDLWMRSSKLMSAVVRDQGGMYIHVLQPNQYFSNHSFSPKEKEIALSGSSPYSKFVRDGYRHMHEQGLLLRLDGVSFFSAVDIFDNSPDILYADNCCHYNQFGNEILADFIAQKIIDGLEISSN